MSQSVARRFDGKSALVTGGGSGIGAACALRLAAEGAAVAVLDIDAAGSARIVEDIRGQGGRATAIQTDVSDFDSVERAVAQLRKEFGRLDVAINNAGMGGAFHSIVDIPLQQWTSTIAINLTGVFHCLRAELPVMAAQGGGAIVNMASIMGTVAAANVGAYVASKHGVVGLTKVAAIEFGPKQVRVNAIGPTFVKTPLTNTVDEAGWTALASMHALGRMPTVEDVALLAAFLASDDARSITGSLHLVDAGYTAT
jgi:NAD(P)-dependent dehydrogenase (short-subunit alcohol dehydrogenase family)